MVVELKADGLYIEDDRLATESYVPKLVTLSN
uniref:Uncharacterized protein n=1 Tax=Podoviridae sp. ct8Lf7 TaxID=2827723 RepID=A0A8S5S0Z5_9CAUD|nr:MAG TPA: hypothetical protein [Podoviridae sp. ct8Lf7]